MRPAGQRSTVTKEPVGPVAAFSPWNFPLGNPGRKLGAPIAAGCSVILKSAEETPASALGVLQALLDAGLPKEVAQAVFGVPDEVSRHLLGSPIIRKLSFTGSTVVGKQLLKLAADDMKRTTMELGGHGPVLVFDDVDVDRVLDVMVDGQISQCRPGLRLADPLHRPGGRSSTASSPASPSGRRAIKVGDGLDADTQMGPMANPRRPDAMERLIGDAKAQGRQAPHRRRADRQPGLFLRADGALRRAARRRDHERGAVRPGRASSTRSRGDEDMIAEANRLPYGLAAYAWTADSRRQKIVAREIESGMVGINSVMIGGADSPFGGVRWSGHGAEDGPEGVEACLVTKAVHEG